MRRILAAHLRQNHPRRGLRPAYRDARRAAERRIIMGHIDDARTRPDLAGSWRTVVLPATTLARCAAVRVSIRIVLLPWNIRPTATSAALPPARWVLAPRRVESFNTSVHEDVSTSTPCCRSRRTAGRSDWCPWSNDDHSRRAVTWPCWCHQNLLIRNCYIENTLKYYLLTSMQTI